MFRTVLALVFCSLFFPPAAVFAEAPNKLPFELKRLLLEKNYDALNQKLLVLASSGDSAAQYQLGLNYKNGLGVSVDREQSLHWVRLAADQGHINAQFDSAILLLDQSGQQQRALSYLAMAAEQGHAMAAKVQLKLADSDQPDADEASQKLLYGAKHGELDLVIGSFKNNAAPNVRNEAGQNALHLAIENDQFELVEVLLEHRVDAKSLDNQGNSVLHYAVKFEAKNALKAIARLSNMEQRNSKSQTALMLAIQLGKENTAAQLIAMGADVNALDLNGRSLLELAEQRDLQKVLEALKGRGGVVVANANEASRKRRVDALKIQLQQSNYADWDLLMLASWLGEEDVVAWALLDTAKTINLVPAIELALQKKHRAIALMLCGELVNQELPSSTIDELANLAIESGDVDSFKLLSRMSSREDKNHQLWYAIQVSSPKIYGFLLDQAIDIGYQATDGSSFLHQAAANGLVELVEKLLVRGAPLDRPDAMGLSALNLAVDAGYRNVVEALILSGADTNSADLGGRTPLLRAVINNDFGVAELLLLAGADLEFRTNNGNTVLIAAAEKSTAAMVAYLIAKNSEVEARNDRSYTALMTAVQRGDRDVAQLLLVAGADPSRRSRNGKSALMMSSDDAMLAVLRNFD